MYKFYPDLYGLKNIFGMSDDLFKMIWMMNYCMFSVTSFDRNNWSWSFFYLSSCGGMETTRESGGNEVIRCSRFTKLEKYTLANFLYYSPGTSVTKHLIKLEKGLY